MSDLPDDLPQPQNILALIEVLKTKVEIEEENWNTAKSAFDYSKTHDQKVPEEVNSLLSYSTGRKRLCNEIIAMLESMPQK